MRTDQADRLRRSLCGRQATDATTGRVGVVVQVGPTYECAKQILAEAGTVWLRPVGGGREWQTTLAAVIPVTQ